MSAVLSAAVQIYFAGRILTLSRSRILTGIIIIMALAQMSAGIAAAVNWKLHGLLLSPHVRDIGVYDCAAFVWLAGSALVDLTIAISMMVSLHKARTGFNQTDGLINRLMRLVVETGTLTASVAIVTLALFLGCSNTLLSECPMLMISKIYANTLLALFNNRAFMDQQRKGASANNTLLQQLSTRTLPPEAPPPPDEAIPRNPIVVTVLRETHCDAFPLNKMQKGQKEDMSIDSEF
ncbi:hypothetical protein AcV7_009827 [Taiwanofungus camphoratus]|nr:hypothetical protein AcW2_007314 [Antrodia cinnamomea]KAI0947386.1 hypothetical protein AcV7_009827 [Antrodia cinnamomea]